MLIGVSFNLPLLRNALRFYHHSLGSRLLINHSDLLTQLCVHDIRILAEMQIFEFFVLWFSVWLYDRGNKELVQIDTINFSTFLLNFERRIASETLASSRKFKVQLQGTPLDFRGY